jgi:potassium-transporting ATPase KdpC subunit
MTRLPSWLAQHWAALRMLLVLTVLLGLAYPLAVLAVAQLPGLKHRADGSLTGHGSAIIGQSFTDSKGDPLVQYFQSRPSAGGYDPTVTGASNLGPESVVDVLPDPSVKDDTGKPSLLTQVCERSAAVGKLEGVSGARPYCTPDGVGAVLGVFYGPVASGPVTDGPVTRVVSLNEACPTAPFLTTYKGVQVECAKPGEDYAKGVITPIRGEAGKPAVPADAVTASASGLDPGISVDYADLQVARVARERGVSPADVRALVKKYTDGRALGFMGEPTVNVVALNAALDERYPFHS